MICFAAKLLNWRAVERGSWEHADDSDAAHTQRGPRNDHKKAALSLCAVARTGTCERPFTHTIFFEETRTACQLTREFELGGLCGGGGCSIQYKFPLFALIFGGGWLSKHHTILWWSGFQNFASLRCWPSWLRVGLSPNGLPASRFRVNKWQIWDGKRKTCFSPSRIVIFLPVQQVLYRRGQNVTFFRRMWLKTLQVKKDIFVCESVTFFPEMWQMWRVTLFVTETSDKHPNLRREPGNKSG